MNKKHSLMLGLILLGVAVLFVAYAAGHPEASFPWGNRVTFIVYGVYAAFLFKFLIEIPFFAGIRRGSGESSNLPGKIVLYSALAVIFLGMALVSRPVSVYTALQAFIVFESCDLLRENLLQYRKSKKPTL